MEEAAAAAEAAGAALGLVVVAGAADLGGADFSRATEAAAASSGVLAGVGVLAELNGCLTVGAAPGARALPKLWVVAVAAGLKKDINLDCCIMTLFSGGSLLLIHNTAVSKSLFRALF
jgi:hypothetical protein